MLRGNRLATERGVVCRARAPLPNAQVEELTIYRCEYWKGLVSSRKGLKSGPPRPLDRIAELDRNSQCQRVVTRR